jgi:sirohydrochlorin ferrochelatase
MLTGDAHHHAPYRAYVPARPGDQRPDPVLLLIAHGSRDPRHAATVQALTQRIRRLRPGTRVATGYLDHCAPRIPQVVGRLAESGTAAVAVPLLLGSAYHAKTDIPGALRDVASRHPNAPVLPLADVLGPSPLLLAALDRRLAEAGLDVGSAAAAPPYVPDAVAALRAASAAHLAVAPYLIAPGLLPDRITAAAAAAGADRCAAVLGAAPEVARLLLRRYDEVRAAAVPPAAPLSALSA